MLEKKPRVLIGALKNNVRRLVLAKLKFDYPARLSLGGILIFFFSLLSGWGQFSVNLKEFDPNLSLSGHEGVSLYERRFVEVKNELPAQGVVGYVSDTQPDSAEFYLTQYALSPLIVDKSQPHELVIGNFANKNSDVKALTNMSLTLRKDFGNGVKLFALESK